MRLLHECAVDTRLVLPPRTNGVRCHFSAKHTANGVLEVELVLSEVKFIALPHFRGMPSIRSAMMLRRISLVPA